MYNPRWVFASAMLVVWAAIPLGGVAKADGLDHRLFGAWAQSPGDCKKVFELKNGKLSFRQPINELVPAFIIRKHEIVASGGRCQVSKATSEGVQILASLYCNNTVGFAPLSARFKIVSESEIVYGATDNPILDSAYERCR